jgi:uncharacterized protein YndB with AHSA1/START domain
MSVACQQAFAAWLDEDRAGQWLFATAHAPLERVAIDARVGGAFELVARRGARTLVAHTGAYMALEPPHRLVMLLHSEDLGSDRTLVTVDIVPLAVGCTVKVRHEDVPPERSAYARNRWSGMLYGLDQLLDNGFDEPATAGPLVNADAVDADSIPFHSAAERRHAGES